MGISASIFRKDEYVTERDLDAIIDIFVEMEFYASDKSKDKESNVWSVSFVNDHWREVWDRPKYIHDEFRNDSAIIYFYEDSKEALDSYVPILGKVSTCFLIFEDIAYREIMMLEFLHRYFSVFPEDIFWVDYFYTKSDIDKVYAKLPWNETWMYEDPSTF